MKYYLLQTNRILSLLKGSYVGYPFSFEYFCKIKMTIMQVLLSTSYLPPISWLALAIQFENTLIEIYETYPKQTYRNRCQIATSTGTLNLTIPVMRINGNHTITKDIEIDNSKNWQQLHWRSIITAYNKAPFFLFYRDYFEPLFTKNYNSLIEYNYKIIEILVEVIKLKPLTFQYTDHFDFNPDCLDLRNSISPKLSNQEKFNIDFPRYIQVFEENYGFIPDLSILDLLFNLGPEASSYLAGIKFKFSNLINGL
jgi:hypothetical protein